MTIVLQDDSGTVIGANAYVDVDYVDAYAINFSMDDSDWADYDDSEKESAIIAATMFIDNSNAGDIKGTRAFQAQSTAFPRINLYDLDGYQVLGLPGLLKAATAEYSFRAVVESLAPDPVYDDSGLPIKSKKEKIGPLEESVTYQDNDSNSGNVYVAKKYPEAEMLLKNYINKSNFLRRA